jgi:hypothetical protein
MAVFSVATIAAVAAAHAQVKAYLQPGVAQAPAAPAAKSVEGSATATPSPAEPGTIEKFFDGKIPDALAKGKFSFNVRLRYEGAEQEGIPAISKNSNAPTIRTRFGYTSAPLYGFQAMIEGEDIHVLGPESNYNAAGSNGQGSRPVVPDPPTTELNQAWLSYAYTNVAAIKGGRQRIVLDNHRFIGDVGWRQNMQTFDSAVLESKPMEELSLFYGYIWNVNRVYGDVDGLPPANRDFDSNSHLFNVSYTPFKFGRFVAYSYLLDLENAAGAVNSCATYGGYFAGSTDATDRLSLGYRAEFAWQTDYGNSPLNYGTEYANLELSATIKPFAAGAGLELLGTDHGTSFRTPLATLHAFNGWADQFSTTPAQGLRDLYAFAQVTFPWQLPLRFVYHKYDAESGGADFGQEFDAVLSRSFGKHWNTMLKYAYYDGRDAAPPVIAFANVDTQKVWAQVEFNW